MIKDIVNNIIEELLDEWNDKEFKTKIHDRFIDPIIFYLIDRMYPYFMLTSIIIFILLFLLIMILYLLLTKNK